MSETKNPLDALFDNLDDTEADWGDESVELDFFDAVQKKEEKKESAPVVPIKQKAEPAPVVPIKAAQAPVKEEEKDEKATKGTAKGGKGAKKGATANNAQKKALSDKIKAEKKRREEMKVDGTWTICYAGQQDNPPHEMKLEEVRAWMELDYPELSKERCRIEVDEEKKLVIPIVSGAKNG